NDARAMAGTLQSMGFEVMKYEDLSGTDMKRVINEFGKRLAGNDVGLFYYAGHGIQYKGTNYMISIEANLQNEEQIEFNCVSADRIVCFMETARAKVNVIIMDACRNNPFERSWRRSTNGNGLAMMNAPSGTLIAYATAPGTTAADGDGVNGLYTSAILKYIKDENLTIEQVFKKVRTEVEERSGRMQIPWETTSLKGEDFYVARGVKPVKQQQAVVERVPVSPENEKQAEVHYKKGLTNFDEGLYNDAMSDFSKAITLNPNYAEAYYMMGRVKFVLKLDYDALADLTRAIQFKPNLADAYYYRGSVYYALRMDAEAIYDFSECIKLKPDYIEAHYYRGQSYYGSHNYDEAIKNFTQTLALKPSHLDALY